MPAAPTRPRDPRAGLIAFFLALCMVCAPGLAQTVVHPTGDPAQDVPAVRAAVQAGGVVMLKATDAAGHPRAFDFGSYPVGAIDWDVAGAGYVALGIWGEVVPIEIGGFTLHVSVGNDVHLLGERVDGAMTTIRGGTVPVRNFAPRAVPGVGVVTVFGLSSLRIEGIRFVESALQSVYTTQLFHFEPVRSWARERGLSVRTEILRSEFVDVQPALSFFWYALGAVTDAPAGPVTLHGNDVRFTPGRWDAAERGYEQAHGLPPRGELWEGLSIAELHDAGTVAHNRVHGVDVGLLVYFAGSNRVEVRDNHVELRPEGLVGISCQANHRYVVERNTVIAPGANPDGIVLWASDPELGINGSTVQGNRVVLDGSDWGGITLFGAGSANHFGQNRVEGSAAYAVGLVADPFGPSPPAQGNAFVGTQLSRFAPRDSAVYGPGVHVFFDAHTQWNTFVGRAETVRDLGVANVVTGVHRAGPGVGPTLAAALAARRALLRQARPDTSHPVVH